MEVATEDMMRKTMDYVDFKAELLCQLGLNNKEEVKAHLKSKSANAETELKRRIQIDNAARTIMMEYYDGDRTFTLAKKQKSFLADAM